MLIERLLSAAEDDSLLHRLRLIRAHRLLEQLKVAVVLPAVAECSTNVRDGEGSHLREGEEVQEDGEGGERY